MNEYPRNEELNEDYFADETRWQSWLDVEAALALSQAEIGMIPKAAALQIAENAHLSRLDLAHLRAEIANTMAPVFALSESLANRSGASGAYVHWGATTQNIIETGRLIVLKRVQSRILTGLEKVLTHLCDQADTYADVVMVGRTNLQNALPITYGFKIAGWIDELLRVQDQLREVEPRLFQLRFGGAIGGYHSFGADGPRLAEHLAERLGLPVSLVPNRTSVDPLIEYITRLSMLGLAVGRMANELYLLMSEEIGEVSESQSKHVVGSSTMPQKINPKHVVKLSASAQQLQSKAAAAFAVQCPSHEGDSVTNQHLSQLVNETCILAIDVIDQTCSTLPQIKPNIDRMRTNFEKSRELMATERLMMMLAESMGRPRAHELMHDITQNATLNGQSLRSALQSNANIVETIGADRIDEILSREEHTGHCAGIARQAAAQSHNR